MSPGDDNPCHAARACESLRHAKISEVCFSSDSDPQCQGAVAFSEFKIVHYQYRLRGAVHGSWRETMTTGCVLAASPQSASEISPGWGLIEQIEDVLFGGARAHEVKDVAIGELYKLNDALPGLCRCLRFPIA
jgi:hypothetical protein